VVGLDNLNDYYDPALKQARLEQLRSRPNFHFEKLDLVNRDVIAALFAREKFSRVLHLAAQAGVRYSLQNPHAYVESNLIGFLHILEGCRHQAVEHLVYASSSSVYGLNTKMPFAVGDTVDHPVSLYAATKKSNELMAHSYSHLYRLPTTGLRFFTVYGPWGRPDMAYYTFARSIFAGEPINVYNDGKMRRDFTYIDDIVEAIIRLLDRPAQPDPHWNSLQPDPSTSSAPWRLYNLGNNSPVELGHFIATLEKAIGRSAVLRYQPLQPGDVIATAADVTALQEANITLKSLPINKIEFLRIPPLKGGFRLPRHASCLKVKRCEQ
jgi:UDP-glucuronate 4-epimerase